MRMDRRTEYGSRHAGDRDVGDRNDARRTWLTVDGGELTEEFPGIDHAQQDLPAACRLQLDARRSGHNEEYIVAHFLVIDDPLILGDPSPGAPGVQPGYRVGRKRRKELDFCQGLDLAA